jgi:hypothetical protein
MGMKKCADSEHREHSPEAASEKTSMLTRVSNTSDLWRFISGLKEDRERAKARKREGRKTGTRRIDHEIHEGHEGLREDAEH